MPRTQYRIHVGTASILLVFMTLCLVSFAVLTIVNAQADYNLSEKLAARTTAYYAAVDEAETFIADTDDTLRALFAEAADAEAYYEAVRETFDENADPVPGTEPSEEGGTGEGTSGTGAPGTAPAHVYEITRLFPVTDLQSLRVTLAVDYPQAAAPRSEAPRGACYRVTVYRVETDELSLDYDTTLHIITP